ncbi:MAG: BON domain-containing protein [Candidatus Thiodiazotropha sp. (ex Monitilora ramsayi)]|nr:BON domain-containing protein [Candidatus Thiodiazotropha sp. (ex Monitilora ramsayi)]
MLKPAGISLTLLTLILLLQGCAAFVVGGAATTAVVAHDRRTTGIMVEDQSIELKSYDRLSKDTLVKQDSKINVTSYNKVVLLTGQAPSENVRRKAEQIVSEVEQVRRVVNEVEIGSTASFGEHSRDVALTAEVKLRLTKIDLPDFDSLRVKVVTERGAVFLMGLLTKEEAHAVTEVVRYVSGVRRVVKVFEYI